MKVIRTPSAPIREQTVTNLREGITSGYFKPGERLIERKLCKLMGISRTPLREAMRQLETEGLIEIESFSGPRVAVVTFEQAQDIYQVRILLESFACRLFALNATNKEIRDLRRVFNQIEKTSETVKTTDLVALKDEFYDIILIGCGNRLISFIFKSITARIAFLRRTSLSQSGRPAKSIAEVRRIVEAIEKRDADAAWEASMHHVKIARDNALRGLKSDFKDTDYKEENINVNQL
jgi:DNA-binding GntR family transcriptional regulator